MQSVREILNGEQDAPATADGAYWTIREALGWATELLRASDIDSSRFEAEELLAHSLQVDRLALYLQPSKTIDRQVSHHFKELIRLRSSGTPSAHLVGKVDFHKIQLRVNANVLIPRPETEELVEKIIRDFDNLQRKSGLPLNLLDLGTGSGAIAIALVKEWPHAKAVAVDCSIEALNLARLNAESNGVGDRITFLESDWTSAVSGQFDLIVSNPPYIATEALTTLSKEVLDHEPRIALDGGTKGTDAIARILSETTRLLSPGCPIYLEIGYDQRDAVELLFQQSSGFMSCEIFRDAAGRDRIVRAYRRGS